jgi:copper(I)-binding protein
LLPPIRYHFDQSEIAAGLRAVVRRGAMQMKLLNLTIAAAALFAVFHAGPLQAQDIKAGTLEIKQPWARATPKGAQVGGGYFSVTNTGKTADRLVGGSSEVSGKFEIHSMTMDNGVMRMRPVAGGLEIKPGETLVLKPGGYHIMFMDLKKPLTKGAKLKGTLVFEKAGTIAVQYVVLALGAKPPGAMDGKMNMKH